MVHLPFLNKRETNSLFQAAEVINWADFLLLLFGWLCQSVVRVLQLACALRNFELTKRKGSSSKALMEITNIAHL